MTHPVYQVVDPATGALVESFPHATDVEIQDVLGASHAAYLTWRKRTVDDRAALLRRAGKALAEHADDLAESMRREMGKPLAEGVEEVEYCAAIFDHYATAGPDLVADQELPVRNNVTAVLQSRPLGPLLGVMPWNFPAYQVARFTAPNLLLGNTIIVKHAESVPRTAAALEAVLVEAGLP
ncbi:aldehyde dehydrogenase family protein, partial [Umezawaea sp. NPDC059074]|uniref:aldehyde dehydrogenase family protein n=1 Tax=Umezawaea sp. NPDC059074 TaxID=3346716 RepID=UPI003688CC10